MSFRGAVRVLTACAPVLLAVSLLSACGADDECQSFAVSRAVTTGGATSEVAAAEELARSSSTFDLPEDGWTLRMSDAAGAEVASGRTVLHAVRGTDGTWFIDSGRCE